MLVFIICKVLAGIGLGYFGATMMESLAHEYVSDARGRYVTFWKRWPGLFGYLIRTYYSHHTIHHVRTFRKDHITQFASEEERRALDAELVRRGRHGQIILRSNYAVKLHGTGALVFVSPALVVIPAIYLVIGPWGLLGAVLPAAAPPLLSNFVHPYLHMRHEVAITTAPQPIAWLLATRYGRAMARNHFLHHRYGDCNYNLLLGGDILRGACRSPSEIDVQEMRRIGLRVD